MGITKSIAMKLRLRLLYISQKSKWWGPKYKKTSMLKVFCKKGVLRNFVKFTGKHLCQSLFLNKVSGWGANWKRLSFHINYS